MSVRNAVDKFLSKSELSAHYNLTPYHRELLRVVARYCDMNHHFCFISIQNLAQECGMSYRQAKDLITELSQLKFKRNKKFYEGMGLIFKTGNGRGNKLRIGEEITGIPNEFEE